MICAFDCASDKAWPFVMSSLSNVSLPKPKDWQDFERKVRDLFAWVLADPNTQMNGRTGQPQHGVDIWGHRNEDRARLVGIQCKNSNDPITAVELETELEKATQFEPGIAEFILVTTAPRDATIQKKARQLTKARAQSARPILIAVWGWQDVEEHAAKYDRVWQAFCPTYNPYAERVRQDILARLDKIENQLIGKGQDPHSGAAASTGIQETLGIARTFGLKVKRFIDEYLISDTGVVPFGGRERELQCLDAWLSDENAASRMLVSAPAGLGKSALLVQWMKSLQDHGVVAEAGWNLVFVPISIRVGTSRPVDFWGGLAQRLAEITGTPIPPDAIQNGDALKDVVHGQLEAIASAKKQTLVIIDGLDEALQGTFDSSFIPSGIPQTLRILLSARWQVGDVDSAGWLRRLEWDRNIRSAKLELACLNREAVADVLLKLGAPADMLAYQQHLVERLSDLTKGEPILVRYYAEDLWDLSHDRARISIGDLDSLKPGFHNYFARWMSYQERLWSAEGIVDAGDTADSVLSILAFALGPLESRDLLDLMKAIHLRDDLIAEHRLLQPLRRFILGNGKPESGYVLCHPKVGEYLQAERFGARAATLRRALAIWGLNHLRDLNADRIEPHEASLYALQFLRGHFENAGLRATEWAELAENGWRRAWEHFEGVPRGFASDVQAAWNRLRREADQTSTVGARWRCALVLSSIRSIGINTPDELLCAAVTYGLLSIRQAVHFAEMGRSDAEAAWLLSQLSHLRVVSTAQSAALISTALDKARSCRDQKSRAQALASLTPHLVNEQKACALSDALTTAKATGDENTHAQVLASLAPHLSPEQSAEALAAASTFGFEAYRAKVLASLAPHLPPEQLAQALVVARSIDYEPYRVEALMSLVPHLAGEQRARALSDAFAAVNAIGADFSCEGVVAFVAPYLSPEQLSNMLARAKAIRYGMDRAVALASLGPHLSPEQLAEALGAAESIDDAQARAKALAALAAYLAPEQKAEVLSDALAAVKAIFNEVYRSVGLAFVAPHLLPEQLAEALAAAKAIGDEKSRALALASLAPRLSSEHVAEALAAARTIGDEQDRAAALKSLAPHLLPQQLAEALAATKAIVNDRHRVAALGWLAPYLLPEQLAEALAIAKATGNEDYRAWALLHLAWHLSQEQLAEAFAVAMALGDEASRVKALFYFAWNRSPEQLAQALAAAKAIGNESSRAALLQRLAQYLPPEEKTETLAEALATAKAISDEGLRALVLNSLASDLAPEQIAEAIAAAEAINGRDIRARALASLARYLSLEQLAEALAGAKAISNERDRAHALTSLAPHLAPEQKAEALSHALAAVMATKHEVFRAGELKSLIPHLLPEQLAEVLTAAEANSSEPFFRVKALESLAPYLPPELIAEALAATKTIDDRWNPAEAVASLAPRLSPDQLGEAFAAAKAIGSGWGRADALESLAPHLSPEQLAEALTATMTIDDDYRRATALGSLAPHLSPEQLAEALTIAKQIANDQARATALESLAPHVLPIQYTPLLNCVMETAARLNRGQALKAISKSLHISAALAGAEGLEGIHRAINDTARWYP
jgi:hypothetical protein